MRQLPTFWLATTAAITGFLAGGSASAEQAPDRSSRVFIEQVGDGNRISVSQSSASGEAANRAFVVVRGNDNGTGMIAARVATGVTTYPGTFTSGNGRGKGHDADGTSEARGGHKSHGNGNGYGHGSFEPNPAADIQAPTVPSGVIDQHGTHNQALVSIGPLGVLHGDGNDFHIAQYGSFNGGAQIIRGSNNAAVVLQGAEGAPVSGNVAVQLQMGADNYAYAAQNGDGNISKQLQTGSASSVVSAFLINNPEAALVQDGLLDDGRGNSSLVEQNGDENSALTVQTGSGNQIGLRQPGSAFAAITQIGNGHSIAIEQMAGIYGVTPITIIQSR